MLHLLLNAGYAWNKRRQERIRAETMMFCASCDSEVPRDNTRFCPKCGANDWLSLEEFDAREKLRGEQEESVLETKRNRNDALEAIARLSAASYCARCLLAYQDQPAFCRQCGAPIQGQHPPRDAVFTTLQPQFPRLLQTFRDFEVLEGQPKEPGVKFMLFTNRLLRGARGYWRWNTFSRRQ